MVGGLDEPQFSRPDPARSRGLVHAVNPNLERQSETYRRIALPPPIPEAIQWGARRSTFTYEELLVVVGTIGLALLVVADIGGANILQDLLPGTAIKTIPHAMIVFFEGVVTICFSWLAWACVPNVAASGKPAIRAIAVTTAAIGLLGMMVASFEFFHHISITDSQSRCPCATQWKPADLANGVSILFKQ